jgi:hypothetical protein
VRALVIPDDGFFCCYISARFVKSSFSFDIAFASVPKPSLRLQISHTTLLYLFDGKTQLRHEVEIVINGVGNNQEYK